MARLKGVIFGIRDVLARSGSLDKEVFFETGTHFNLLLLALLAAMRPLAWADKRDRQTHGGP